MRHRLRAALFAATTLSGGCFTLGNPVPDAIPVRRLPDEVLHNCPTCLTPIPAPAAPAADLNEVTTTKFQVKPGSEAPPVVNAVPPPPASCGKNGCGAVFYTGGSLGSG